MGNQHFGSISLNSLKVSTNKIFRSLAGADISKVKHNFLILLHNFRNNQELTYGDMQAMRVK